MIALVSLLACKAYKPELIAERAGAGGSAGTGGQGGSPMDGGGGTGGSARPDAAGDEDGGMCVERPEACNLRDDDCDGRTDEDTTSACEAIIVNAETECVVIAGEARCALRSCREGYASCDGDPTNGCEQPYCACHPCDADAGSDDGGAP